MLLARISYSCDEPKITRDTMEVMSNGKVEGLNRDLCDRLEFNIKYFDRSSTGSGGALFYYTIYKFVAKMKEVFGEENVTFSYYGEPGRGDVTTDDE